MVSSSWLHASGECNNNNNKDNNNDGNNTLSVWESLNISSNSLFRVGRVEKESEDMLEVRQKRRRKVSMLTEPSWILPGAPSRRRTRRRRTITSRTSLRLHQLSDNLTPPPQSSHNSTFLQFIEELGPL